MLQQTAVEDYPWYDIDLIPIHLILAKQSIVKPQETAKRNGASARACSRKGMICSVLVGKCNVYSLYMSFVKYIMIIIIIDNIFVYMYIHMFQSFCIYDIYVCINMPGLGDLMIFQEFIIMSSSFFSIFQLEIPSRLQKPGMACRFGWPSRSHTFWPETTENIAANWGLLGKNGQLVLRVVALEAESCGNPMDVTELTGVGSTPSHQSPAWGHCLCAGGVRVVFFSPQHIVHTYYLEFGVQRGIFK